MNLRQAHQMVAAVKAAGLRLGLGAVLLMTLASVSSGRTFVAFGPENFVRSPGKPAPVTRAFTVVDPHTTYTLQVHNGGLQGEFARVTDAVITINGVQVLRSRDFGDGDDDDRTRRLLSKPVTLAATNVLVVTVRGGGDGDGDDDDDKRGKGDDRRGKEDDRRRKPRGFTLQIIGVDNVPPIITATTVPAPNAAGWNNTSATVSFSCSDATSGVAACSTPSTVATEGANQTVTGTAVDRAGNTATRSVTLNIDTTPPGLSPILTPAPNSSGWNKTNVTVSFAATDSLSGVATVT